MSVHATSWVLKHSDERLANRLVLLVLADHAHEDGSKSFPSVATIAAEARLSRRAVQNCLRDLEENGSISTVGESHYGTTEYLLHLGERKLCAGENGNEIQENYSNNRLPNAPEPSLEPPSKPSKEEPSPSPQTELEKDFNEFYRAYPLRRKPKEAFAKYRAARKEASHAEIMAGIEPYIKDVERQRAEGFAQLKWQAPSSWLYQGRWKDEYESVGPKITDERRRIEKARRMMSADQRAAAKSLAAYPYDNESARIMGESTEVEDEQEVERDRGSGVARGGTSQGERGSS